MTNSLPTNGKFKPWEMHINNKAYRDFLLKDENAIFNDDGTYNKVAEVCARLSLLYEEGGQELVDSVFIQIEKETGRKISRSR